LNLFAIKTEPIPIQKECEEWAKNRVSCLIRMEMGLGKTRQSLVIAAQKHATKVLAVVPKTAFSHWEREIEKHSYYTHVTIKGNRTKKIQLLSLNTVEIFLINPEGIRTLWKEILKVFPGFDLLIVDELTRFRRYSQQTRTLKRVAEKIPFRIGLTGNLIVEGYRDVFNPALILDDGKTFGKNYFTFLGKYFERNYEEGDPEHKKHDWQPTNYGIRVIPKLLSKVSFSARISECINLPPTHWEKRVVSLSKEQTAALAQLQDDWELDQDREYKTKLEVLLKAKQIASVFIYVQGGEPYTFEFNPKLMELATYLEELGNSKCVIWFRFKWEAVLIGALLKGLKISFTENPEEFDNHQIFLGSLSKYADCIELTQSNHTFYFSRPERYQIYEQSKARNYRKGSEIHPFVKYIILTSKSVGDIHTDRILMEKIELQKYLRSVDLFERKK